MTGRRPVLELELIDEFRIRPGRREAIRRLLADCFASAEFTRHRTYLKQIPSRRLLATMNGRLVAHLGLEHRVIGTSTGPAAILGILDVCVATPCRSKGIASELLAWVGGLAAEHAIDFLLLFATDSRLYEKNGFRRAGNTSRWAKIHEHATIGIGEGPLEEFMVKAVGARTWPDGLVDLLGYQF